MLCRVNFLLYWVELLMFSVMFSWLVFVVGVKVLRLILLLVGVVSLLLLLKVIVVGVLVGWLLI